MSLELVQICHIKHDLLVSGIETMPLQEDQVREALKQVIDPELFVNIVDLGLIYVVDVE